MLRIGAVLMPVGLLLLARKMPSPIRAFRKAGAYSPESARKLSTLGLSGAWLFDGALKSGLVKATTDGRYYLDPGLDRRRRRRYWACVAGLVALTAPAAVWALL